MGAVDSLELAEDIGDVVADHVVSQDELVSDLLVVFAPGYQFKDFAFAFGQVGKEFFLG
ncbi:hypothetical protein KDK_70950 [Dictyobacter kobayashii]|uniref:Uncharacterized protein n=1 Tax=Dictyobacter kobayashii TaxID=2014872 RepID=A0A402AW53_9CHLR|nr:hypothetical protein KDK_70950 [Dictyobacter kobayashii]